jgi:uncharacterized protein with PQ loop repeat
MSDTLALSAAAWGVLMALAPVLQIRRMVTTRSSADFSIGYLGVLLIGFGLWMAYGLALGNLALIVPNCVALVIGVATLVVAVRLRPRRTRP